MTEDTSTPVPEDKPKSTTEDVKATAKGFFGSLLTFFKELLNIREGAQIEGTIESIRKDIDFKGHTVWILIASIFIASIGLNTNSTAVIIGAMLISPLMGPIQGLGLAIGTHDFQMATRSLKNLGVAVGISIISSMLFFMLSPFDEPQSELLARTRPTILDALIAAFGGLSGIIAASRKEKSNVVPGVAIATALMPPLCTVGFGLANLKPEFIFGAFYLFLLNSIFICATAFIVVKYLGFPEVNYLDQAKRKRYNRFIIGVILVILLPSAWLFVDVIKESVFATRANSFITENFQYEDRDVVSSKLIYDEELSGIHIYLIGEPLEEEEQVMLRNRMPLYGLSNCELQIHQGTASQKEVTKLGQELRVGIIEEMYQKNVDLIAKKDSTISAQERLLESLQGDTVPLTLLHKELAAIYTGLEAVRYGKVVQLSDSTRDTIPILFIHWNGDLKEDNQLANNEKIETSLRIRLENPELRVVTDQTALD